MVRTNSSVSLPLSTSVDSCMSTSPMRSSSPSMLGISPMSITPPSPSLLQCTTPPSPSLLQSTTPPLPSLLQSTTPPSPSLRQSTTPPSPSLLQSTTPPSPSLLLSTPPPPLIATPSLLTSTTPDVPMSVCPPSPASMSVCPPSPASMSVCPPSPASMSVCPPSPASMSDAPPLFEEVSLGGSEFYQVAKFNLANGIPPRGPITVRKTQDRGLGMFTTTKVFPGTVLLVERPLIVMPDKVYYSDNFHKISKWVDKHVSQLPPEEKKLFNSLTDGGGRPGPLNLKSRTFFTNDMNYGEEAGLFPAMARANHACCPNADFVSRPDIGVQILVAVAPIEAGEEVFISYLPQDEEGSDVRKVRQNYLRSFYGFRCQCEVCTMRGSPLAQNDNTRAQIREQQEDEDIKLKSQSVEDLQDLIQKLHKIGGKLPYIMKIHEMIYRKAIKSEDWPLVVLEGVAGWNIALMMFGPKSPQEKLWKERCLVKLVTVQMEIEETEKTFRMFETIDEREQEMMFETIDEREQELMFQFMENDEVEANKLDQNSEVHEMDQDDHEQEMKE